MARSSGSRRRKKGGAAPLIYVGAALVVFALLVVLVLALKGGGKEDSLAVKGQFNTEQYIKRGSSSVGNTYKIQASVMEVNSHGGNRLVEILTSDNHRIGVYVPSGTSLSSNIRKGMDYKFTVKCRNGMLEDGSNVKGVLIVVDVEAI